LRHAYLVYRATTHRLNLQDQPARIAGDRFDDLRRGVEAVWQRYLGGARP
jgi:glutamate-ammonia-ligase adenylyltransferase